MARPQDDHAEPKPGTENPMSGSGLRDPEPKVISAGEEEPVGEGQGELFPPKPASQPDLSPDSAGVKP